MKFIQSLKERIDYFKNYKKYQEEEELDVARISYLENQRFETLKIHNHELENKDMIISLQKDELDKINDKCNKLIEKLNNEEKQNKKLISDNKQLANVIEIKTEKNKQLKQLVHELQGSKGGLIKQNNILKQSLEDMKNRYNFVLTKIPKKSIEEIKAYIYGDKEVLKRIKESKDE